MSTVPQQKPPKPVQLHERALRDVAIIRGTMERSTVFTSVSGPGIMAMGLIALIGAPIAALRHSEFWWVNTWVLIGVFGFTAGMSGLILKSRRTRTPLFRGAGRRFLLAFAPAILAGCILSEYFVEHHSQYMLPPMWILLYGVSVTTSGAYSVPVIPIMGLSFMLTGALAAFTPAPLQNLYIGHMLLPDLLLTFSFSGLHLLFGAIIWIRHPGNET